MIWLEHYNWTRTGQLSLISPCFYAHTFIDQHTRHWNKMWRKLIQKANFDLPVYEHQGRDLVTHFTKPSCNRQWKNHNHHKGGTCRFVIGMVQFLEMYLVMQGWKLQLPKRNNYYHSLQRWMFRFGIIELSQNDRVTMRNVESSINNEEDCLHVIQEYFYMVSVRDADFPSELKSMIIYISIKIIIHNNIIKAICKKAA